MKIIVLGGDSTLCDPASKSAKRIAQYSVIVDKMLIVVPNIQNISVNISNNICVRGSGGNNRFIQLLKIWFVVKNIVQSGDKYDVISSQDPFEYGVLAWFLAKKFHLKLNIQEHGDFFSTNYWRNENIFNFIRFYLGKFVIRRADAIRVVSERINRTLVHMGVKDEVITKVPIYVDITKKIIEKNYPISYQDKFIFLNIGRWVKQKNIPLLIRAFYRVVKKEKKVMLLLAGRGPEERKISKLIRKLHLEDFVIIQEWADDPSVYYQKADAYVLSSNYEGWGMVIIEAASYGLPVIMTNTGCAGEVIEDRKSGLIVPVGDEIKLADAMLKILEDKNFARNICEGASANLSMLPNKETTLQLYKKSWSAK